MISSSILRFTSALGYASWVIGAFAALFAFWSRAQTQPEQSKYRNWFGAAWRTVEDSPWPTLPERVISWFLRGKNEAWHRSRTYVSIKKFLDRSDLLLVEVWISFLIGFTVGLFLWRRQANVSLSALTSFIVSGFIFLFLTKVPQLFTAAAGGVERAKLNAILLGLFIAGVPVAIIALVTLVILGKLLFTLPTGIALVATVIIMPASFFCISVVIQLVRDLIRSSLSVKLPRKSAELFARASALGISLTFLALYVGHTLEPKTWVPQKPQVLVFNLIFDGLTVAMTIKILGILVDRAKPFFVPLVICLNIIVAGLFAVASLWCGLAFTSNYLSAIDVLHVFLGRSPDGLRWEFGPYFWVMHTTFLPILIFLSLVTLCWMAKAFLIPIRWFLGRGQHPDINPLALTGGLLGVIAVGLAGAKQMAELLLK